MAFNIKIPFMIATHVKKFATITNLKSKSKAGAVGMTNTGTTDQLFAHCGTSVTPVSGYFGNPISLNAAPSNTIALTPQQSGATILLDIATGGTITLPAPQVGLWYDFFATVSVTSNNYKVASGVPTALMLGSIWETVAAGTGTQFFPNASSNTAITMAGTTKGGLQGTCFQVACLSATVWSIDGTNVASGTIVNPFTDT